MSHKYDRSFQESWGRTFLIHIQSRITVKCLTVTFIVEYDIKAIMLQCCMFWRVVIYWLTWSNARLKSVRTSNLDRVLSFSEYIQHIKRWNVLYWKHMCRWNLDQNWQSCHIFFFFDWSPLVAWGVSHQYSKLSTITLSHIMHNKLSDFTHPFWLNVNWTVDDILFLYTSDICYEKCS